MRRVYSKSQALSQCRNWLGKNLPQATNVDVVSTAAAAELAQREEFAAAVASRAAAQAYRLNILAENIEDQVHNVTRFAVIAEVAEQRTGRDKTTLMLRLPNQVGSLVKTISPFEKFGVNLTWIESFPIPNSPGEQRPLLPVLHGHRWPRVRPQRPEGDRGRPQAVRTARYPGIVSPLQSHRSLRDVITRRPGSWPPSDR